MKGRIEELAEALAASGADVAHLRPLQLELDVVEHPSALRRLSDRALKAARRQLDLALGELDDSRRVVALIAVRVRRMQRLSPEEADEVRGQLADLLKLVPAGLIAATNYTLPIPGTSLFTPVILRRLGLLPSRWREAHLLHALQREALRLRATGRDDAALRVEALRDELALEADAREATRREANVLTHWDANGDGVIDAQEGQAYADELERVRVLADQRAHRRAWYLFSEGEVFGPVRLSELGPAGPELVCYDGRTGWVALAHLQAPGVG